jgi:sugar/nucleoside kinase (ribokinase family)
VVALKLGANGVLIGASGIQPVMLPTHATSVVDSTGAGDAFAAGFLSAWLDSHVPVDAASAGLAAAALAVGTMGGRPSTG